MRSSLGKLFLRARGWRSVGDPPDEPKFVVACAPHTSNWDFIYMQAYAFEKNMQFRWMGKESLFRGPMGPMMRRLGGVPVDRSHAEGVVESMVREFERHDRFILAIAPEGSRGHRDYWKSGFYRIAMAADVPLALGFLDYARRETGFGPCFRLSGDVRADMDRVRRFFEDRGACRPEEFGPIRLRDEGHAHP
jgi:1-acyl-sn-glycerol-3-phosphate acyltransferase